MIAPFLFYIKTKVYFGCEVLESIPQISRLGKKPLIITGKHFVYSTGLLEKIQKKLENISIRWAIFSDVEENPSVKTVEKAAQAFKGQGCDFVLGIGGGSAMDTAKAVAVLSSNSQGLNKYFGEELVQNPPCPIALIPTTSGTGSEVTRFSVIVDEDNNTKKTIASLSIMPDIAFCDPSLTYTLNPYLTASTGLDALSHCIEGILSVRANPITDILNKETIAMIFRWLPVAVKDGKDKQAREQMMLSSLVAGVSLNCTGTMLGHGMGYTLTLDWSVHHGYASLMFLPQIISLIRERYAQRVEVLDKAFVGDFANRKVENSEGKIIELMEKINLKPSLKTIGIEEKDIENLITRIEKNSQRSLRNIGFKFTTQDIEQVVRKTAGS
ncbi:hypothetical protein B9J78_02370 [bacterium Unc6]|nr:hypothetical protein [bacterium Unc6]